jgi:hypothetical protein
MVNRSVEYINELRDPKKNKISVKKQIDRLIDYIRSSSKPEAIELRKRLLDNSDNRDYSFDELRQFNPLIFLKAEKNSNQE